MADIETLRVFEQRLIPMRTTAGQVEAWDAYRSEWLPPLPPNEVALLGQGYAAGYDAAMARVRGLLADSQTEALRENK
jgi:hypothetical protein